MKKVICDRCERGNATHKIKVDELKEIDLCNLCFEDFGRYMERKPFLDLREVFK